MSKSKVIVDLFYDVVSPFSWLGFEVMTRYRPRWNMDLRLRPAFLGGVMNLSGNTPPGLIPNKAKYMPKELARTAEYYNVPFRLPEDPADSMFVKGTLSTMRYVTAIDMSHPQHVESLSREFWLRLWNRALFISNAERVFIKGSLATMRYITAIDLYYPEHLESLSREFWQRIWNKDEDIHNEENFVEASKKIGLSDDIIKDALSRHKTKEVKERLKRSTQEVFDHGAFGFPVFIAHLDSGPEMVYGSDRFEMLARLLGEKWEGPLPELSKCKL